jgi:hypothetical protein
LISTQFDQLLPGFISFGDATGVDTVDPSLCGGICSRPALISLRRKILMAYSRKVLTVGALGVAAFALIGAGASATFSDGVQAQQTISAGTMNMTITSPAAGAWRTTDGKTLTLKPYGPVGSTFSTGAQEIIVSNSSNIDAKMVKLVVSAPTSNNQLRDGIYVKIQTGSADGPVVYDGLLTALESSASPFIQGQTIAHGSSVTADVTFYAGDTNANSAGGARVSLPDGAQGGVVVPTFTVSYTG